MENITLISSEGDKIPILYNVALQSDLIRNALSTEMQEKTTGKINVNIDTVSVKYLIGLLSIHDLNTMLRYLKNNDISFVDVSLLLHHAIYLQAINLISLLNDVLAIYIIDPSYRDNESKGIYQSIQKLSLMGLSYDKGKAEYNIAANKIIKLIISYTIPGFNEDGIFLGYWYNVEELADKLATENVRDLVKDYKTYLEFEHAHQGDPDINDKIFGDKYLQGHGTPDDEGIEIINALDQELNNVLPIDISTREYEDITPYIIHIIIENISSL